MAVGSSEVAVRHFAAVLPADGSKAADSTQRLAALCLAAVHLFSQEEARARDRLTQHSLFEDVDRLGAAERWVLQRVHKARRHLD